MAARTAKEYTMCSFCHREATKVVLFMCIKDDCESFGEIYCERCGKIAHEKNDHNFNTKADHVKAVSLSIIKSNIKVN